MSSSVLEVVALEEGTYALQKIDSDEGPLVIISFSEEVSEFLQDGQEVVAKAMMGAGVKAASRVSRQAAAPEGEEEASAPKTLH